MNIWSFPRHNVRRPSINLIIGTDSSPKESSARFLSMASLLGPATSSVPLQNKVSISTKLIARSSRVSRDSGRSYGRCRINGIIRASAEGSMLVRDARPCGQRNDIGALCVHHVGILCENLERSLDYYQNLLDKRERPHDKLPYRGAWLWVGSEMIHLMELPNPDPLTGRPEHGGRDRHTCITIKDVAKLKAILDNAGIPYTLSKSGRPAIFTRDPDANALEFVQLD